MFSFTGSQFNFTTVLHSWEPSCDKSSACILKPLEALHLKCWKGVENRACIVHFREDVSSLPGVSSHEKGLDFKACAVLTVSRTMNSTHGLHASSRSGVGPRVHPIALCRKSVLVEYRHRR